MSHVKCSNCFDLLRLLMVYVQWMTCTLSILSNRQKSISTKILNKLRNFILEVDFQIS